MDYQPKKKQIKEKIRPPTRIARLKFNHNSNNDDDNNNNDDEFTIEYENYHEDDDDVDLLQQHNNEDDTDVREDIHFRIDSEVWKQKKLKEIEDMKQIFGPALPPEMALAREHKLNEEEMNKQIEEYVIDQPDTRLKRLVEHTIVTKSIMDMF